MTTAYREKEPKLQTPDEQQRSKISRLATLAIVATLTGLLLSFVAISNLNAEVDNLLNSKIPYIQSRLDAISPFIYGHAH